MNPQFTSRVGGLTNRWSGRVKDKVPSSYRGVRAAQLNRQASVEAITPGWRSVFIGFESTPVKIKGFELWKHEWEDLGETIVVAHPSHPAERHTMFVYRIASGGESLKFAAGEYSNGVWGFHEPVSE